jgi:hypothetical protein
MPVGTGTISINEVETEMGLTGTTSLLDLIATAKLAGYNPTYFTSPATSLLEFRGYDHTPTIYTENLNYSATFNVCPSGGAAQTRYTTGSATFSAATGLFTTAAGTTYAATGYYRQGTFWRFWSATTGSFGSAGFC